MTTVPTPVPRSRLPRRVHPVLVAAFVVLAATATVLLAREWGTRWSPTHVVQGSGVAEIQSRAVPGFSGVELAGSGEVLVRVGAEQSVVVTADDNLIDRVTTEVRDETLVLGSRGSFTTRRPLTIDVAVPSLDGVVLTGSGTVTVQGVLADRLSVRLPGSGLLSISGRAEQIDVVLAGSGDILLEDLVARDVTASLSGSGRVQVHATGSLDASVSGTGVIAYRGKTRVITQNVTGTGAVARDEP